MNLQSNGQVDISIDAFLPKFRTLATLLPRHKPSKVELSDACQHLKFEFKKTVLIVPITVKYVRQCANLSDIANEHEKI